MSYITDFEGELIKKLEDRTEDTTAIVHWVSGKILESYKHGIIAGKKGSPMKRQQTTGADGSNTKAE